MPSTPFALLLALVFYRLGPTAQTLNGGTLDASGSAAAWVLDSDQGVIGQPRNPIAITSRR